MSTALLLLLLADHGLADTGAGGAEGSCGGDEYAAASGNLLLQTGRQLDKRTTMHAAGAPPPLCPELADVPVFVLNLNRRADRLGNISGFLRHQAPSPWLGDQACRVSAPDGARFGGRLPPELITPEAWADARDLDASGNYTVGGRLTMGATALTLGHALMWEHAVRSNKTLAVFMEDDITHIGSSLDSLVCSLLSSGRPGAPGPDSDDRALRESVAHMEGWDLVNLQPCPFGVQQSGPVRVEAGFDYCLGMYIMTLEAAKKALENFFPVGARGDPLQLDAPGGSLREQLRGYITVPPLATQVGSAADTDAQITSLPLEEPVLRDCGGLAEDSMIVPALLSPKVAPGSAHVA